MGINSKPIFVEGCKIINEKTIADTAPEAPTALYHEWVLCFSKEGITEEINAPTYIIKNKIWPLEPVIATKISSTAPPKEKST